MKSHTLKQVLIVAVLLLPSLLASAQSNADPNFYARFFGDLTVVASVIIIAIAIFTVLRVSAMLLKMEEIKMLKEKGLDDIAAHYAQPEKPFLAKAWERLQNAVPVNREKEILFDHEYDGIRELDNSLPPWWLGLFYISIIISGIYMYVHHMSDIGLSSTEKYELEMETAKADIEAYLATQADNIDENNVELLIDDESLAAGKEIYTVSCQVCHLEQGQGGVGPNFADNYWIHGGDIKDLFRTIKYGVPEKGMISWSSQLRPSEMQQVASYILTFQGTDPPNQKEPQGEIYEPPLKEAMAQDTTEVTGD